MKVTILGSGTGIPSLARNAAGYLLDINQQQWLIDCGSATLKQLLHVGRSHENLDGIFITHTHPDHIGDLIPLLHALRLPGLTREKPLKIVGPPGFPGFFEEIIVAVAGLPKTFEVIVSEAQNRWQLDGVTICSTPTLHSDKMSSVGYRFEHNGKIIVFSGDSDYDQNIVDLARGGDLVILDCSTLADGKVPGHLSAAECGRVGEEAGAKRLLLSHFYPIEGADSRRQEECQAHFDGKIILAEDFLTVVV
ncbi:MAG: ribonuclease Z [Magnetococcales bacterium]|nr:ribonuclease Z [Magnetococcales bacterium]